MNIKYTFSIFILSLLNLSAQNNWVPQLSGVSVILTHVKVVDRNVVWAGGGSKIIRTIDAGLNWTSVGDENWTGNLCNIDAIDSSTAFVTMTPGLTTFIYRTTNGGSSWLQVFSQDSGFINDIRMIDANKGIAYGDPVNGKWTILKTYDKGATWFRIPSEPTANNAEIGINYNSLCITDSLHIWFVGTNKIYRSFDGGLTWDFTAVNNFLSIWFNTDAVAMGNSFDKTYSTADSGKTWTEAASTPARSYVIAGSGTVDFWLPGEVGYIYHTSNYGLSWTPDSFTGNYLGIDFATFGNIVVGYAVGGNGNGGNLIARYDGTITSINSEAYFSQHYSLKQNYPNPFNPVTKIEYSLPTEGNVVIKIFNILGKEISVLLHEHKTAGSYDLSFDGSTLPGGVYFYQIQSGTFTETKKMILLK